MNSYFWSISPSHRQTNTFFTRTATKHRSNVRADKQCNTESSRDPVRPRWGPFSQWQTFDFQNAFLPICRFFTLFTHRENTAKDFPFASVLVTASYIFIGFQCEGVQSWLLSIKHLFIFFPESFQADKAWVTPASSQNWYYGMTQFKVDCYFHKQMSSFAFSPSWKSRYNQAASVYTISGIIHFSLH